MAQNTPEQLIFVNPNGQVMRLGSSSARQHGEYTAVVLVLIFLPAERQILLFNRGRGASDMHDHWALTAGKMNSTDLGTNTDVIGHKLPLSVARNAAIRELDEELSVVADQNKLELVSDFSIPEKQMHFTMLGWSISRAAVRDFAPDGSEVDEIKLFTLEEFDTNRNLGDAIVYKKAAITEFLQQKFGN